MAFDFKKLYKEQYKPGKNPVLINMPAVNILLFADREIPMKKAALIKQPLAYFMLWPTHCA